MSVVFHPTRTRISVERYQRMVATVVLTKYDRIELIDGEMIDMAPLGTKHVALTSRLVERFVLAAGDSANVCAGSPVNLGDFSEPQPDVMLLRRRADFYASRLPEAADVLLIFGISDSSLPFDQSVKRALYARHGITEYWIVDIPGRRIHVHREPTATGYLHIQEYSGLASVAPQALAQAAVTAQELLG